MSAIITGIGSLSPYGTDHSEIVSALKMERVTIQPLIELWPHVKATSVAPCIENTQFLAPDIPRSIANDALNLSYYVIRKALKDAGYDPEAVCRDSETGPRVALVSAFGATGMDAHASLMNPDKRSSPFDLLKSLPTAVTGPLATLLGIKGPIHTVQHACASGLRVVTQGMDLIELGRADVVICVSVEKVLQEIVGGFDAMRALYRGPNLEHASVPFSPHRAGFTVGEGAGCVILESRAAYFKRPETQQRNYGIALEYADYSDGHDLTNPTGEGGLASLSSVLDTLWHRYGICPDFISAHATSTLKGDAIEAKVLAECERSKDVPVVALKRLLGHSVTASGIVELILCLYMMQEGFIVSHGNLEYDPDLPPINLPKAPIRKPMTAFVKNAFGFGGLNCVLGVSRYV